MSTGGTRTCPRCESESAATDYCDTCGVAMDSPSSAAAAPTGAGSETITISQPPMEEGLVAAGFSCSNCKAARAPDDAFCEVCGLDFTNDEMPQAPPPAPAAPPASAPPAAAVQWTAVIAADRRFFEGNRAEAAKPVVFPEDLEPREVPLTGTEIVVGRSDESRGSYPDIDLSGPVADPCVSRRHAVLHRQPDGSWALTDEGSTNGTWLNGDATPVKRGEPVALREDDRILLGAFTVITLRNDMDGTGP